MSKRYDKEMSLEELAKVPDEAIDYCDMPELPDAFFKHARLLKPAAGKKQLTVRLDADVLDWFKSQGRGYQTHMNAVLRAYMEAQRPEERR